MQKNAKHRDRIASKRYVCLQVYVSRDCYDAVKFEARSQQRKLWQVITEMIRQKYGLNDREAYPTPAGVEPQYKDARFANQRDNKWRASWESNGRRTSD